MVKAEDIDFGDDADRICGVGLFVVSGSCRRG